MREKRRIRRSSWNKAAVFRRLAKTQGWIEKQKGGIHVALHSFKYLLIAQTSLTKVFLSPGCIDSTERPVLSAAYEYVELLGTPSRCSSSMLTRYFIVCLQETMTSDVDLVRPLVLEQNTEYLNHHGPSRLLLHLIYGQKDGAWEMRSV